MVDRETMSFCQVLSAEAYSKHGFNASTIIYDELHAAPNRELYDVLRTSQGTRREPLIIVITTAGLRPDDGVLGDVGLRAQGARRRD